MPTNHTQEQIAEIKKWLGAGSINIFGRPFAGKDTQGRTLSELFDGVIIGGGDILRGNQVPEIVTKTIDAGFLAPSDEYKSIVLPYLKQPEFQGKSLILSSVGRWSGEEIAVVQAAQESGHPIKTVVYLNVSEETVRRRWQKSQDARSRGDRGFRADDNAEILATRLREFATKTLPVIDYYRQAGLLFEVHGDNHSAVEVTAQILGQLLKLAQS